MASISREPNGRRSIQFVAGDGKRRTIRLGKISQRGAEAVKLRVEQLNAAAISGHAVDPDTARWLATLDSPLHEKLARVGLIHERETATLTNYLAAYIVERTDVKPLTVKKYRTTERELVAHFGAEQSLRLITAGDADGWRRSLASCGLAENTVRKHTAVAKVFFNAAQRKGLIEANPFADLKATIQPNTSRYHFVTREDTTAVLEACPDAEWRLLFALSRYGGLRCPSEHLALRWRDILWARGRINVPSPKTEHHAGGESRTVPIFPELLPYLQDAYELAEDGAEFVIARYRDTNSNLRTQLLRIIQRSGLQSWPKLFQNLRSTRETELAEDFPLHVVCAWIGNSQPVAAKHYLQVTDDHFERAASLDGRLEKRDGSRQKGRNAAPQKALQNPVQQPSEMAGMARQPRSEKRDSLGKHGDC
ncbi:MAG: site-specific integrase [Planctomycetales bacterium]|nr:site-specific integrase [Planctomycetales bacterium]